jgi:hypothetical protein
MVCSIIALILLTAPIGKGPAPPSMISCVGEPVAVTQIGWSSVAIVWYILELALTVANATQHMSADMQHPPAPAAALSDADIDTLPTIVLVNVAPSNNVAHRTQTDHLRPPPSAPKHLSPTPLGLEGGQGPSSIAISVAALAPLSLESDNVENCAICLEGMQNSRVKVMPECRHRFHDLCIRTWLRTHPRCPLCRAEVRPIGPRTAIAPTLLSPAQS